MFEIIKNWYERHFSDPNAVALVLVIGGVLAAVLLIGDVLAPVIVATVLAYLLEGVVMSMERFKIPRPIGAIVVMLGFLALGLAFTFGLVPLIYEQISQLISETPRMISSLQGQWLALVAQYPEILTASSADELFNSLRAQLSQLGQVIVTFSLSNVGNVISLTIYSILVPMMVFFALKDKVVILRWVSRFLPNRSDISSRVWADVDEKIANYIRGKFIEILIIGGASYVSFVFLGLNYSLLLALLVGLSVIIPFIGAFAVTVPVLLIGFFQWGIGSDFYTLLVVYLIIQVLDGNVLVPILFSEVVNLHPLAIIVAVTFFGGIWGMWGVFFAIPLATLVQAVLKVWPSIDLESE
ncbi:MAG: AI-2E family transporter [Gammaproteobacteria bacterium]|nr:AI-2E family transporter [Gammaproteobacteria bacterium]